MNTKTKILSLSVLGIMVATGTAIFFAGSAQAYQGDYTKVGPYHTEEREAAMETVMKNKDFDGWKKLMTENGRNPGVLRKIDTKEEFDKFVEAYELGKAGKTAEANAIRAELELGNGQGQRKGMGRGNSSRGQNHGGSFVDANNDGVCDMMQ